MFELKVSPSILAADFGQLQAEIDSVSAESDSIHVDVMDGHFVPNISFGAPVTKWIKSDLPQDVHLMIENPEKYLKDFASAGADRIIVHSEACDVPACLATIKELGCGAGVAIKPATPVSDIAGVLDECDIVIVMTVEPGFGGQKFMHDMVPKIVELRELGYEGDICIDGGINEETATICREAGANVPVAGSYVFKATDRLDACRKVRGI